MAGATLIVERDVGCALSDGTVLASDVYRLDDGERHPVLLQRTPYDKTFYPFTWAALDPMKLTSAGYVVVIQDSRGRFRSEGDYRPYSTEGADGADAIAWCASQPWSDGRVGTYGISYMGAVQWLSAVRRPPALRAIAATTSPNSLSRNNLMRGGALSLGLVTAWNLASIGPNAVARALAGKPELAREFAALIDDMDALDEHAARLPLVPFPPVDERAGGFAPWFEGWVSNGDPEVPAFSHVDIGVPALLIGGWYDIMLQPTLDHFAAMRSDAATPEARALTRLVIGPWAHGAFGQTVGELDFGFRSSGLLLDLREDLSGLHRRWFDARIRGVDSGIDDEQPVKLFLMGANRWRSEDAWPLARATPARWHLHGDGTLSRRPPAEAEPSVFRLDPDDPVPTHGGQILMTTKHIRGPREQCRIEERPDVLVFTSDPLAADLEVTGPVRFLTWVAADTVDSDVVVRLCAVDPDGLSYNVCDGILRLRYRNGAPEPLAPGEVVGVEVDLWSTSYVFKQGHRLRVQVCASDFPRYDRCPGTGESSAVAKEVVPQRNLLFHDPHHPTHIELPEVRS